MTIYRQDNKEVRRRQAYYKHFDDHKTFLRGQYYMGKDKNLNIDEANR
jgi:hypothetical protein